MFDTIRQQEEEALGGLRRPSVGGRSIMQPQGAAPRAEGASEPARLIVLEGDELQEFKTRFEHELRTAQARPIKDSDIARWRGYYAQDRYEVSRGSVNEGVSGEVPGESEADGEEDMPNYTLPVLKRKVRGFRAFARQQLNKDPYFTGRAYGDRARAAQAAMEIIMERNLDLTNARKQLDHSLHEAPLTGTAFIGYWPLRLGEGEEAEVVVPIKTHRLENFYVSPVGVEELTEASTFVRCAEPIWVVREKAGSLYDEAAVEKIRPGGHNSRPLSDSEIREGTTVNAGPQSDNEPVDIWESYYRYNGKLYRVFYADQAMEILHLTISWTQEITGRPPYRPVRVESEADYIYGVPMSRSVEGVQEITDFAYNSHLSYQLIGMSPTVFADETSEFYQAHKGGGLESGRIYGVKGEPRQSIHVVEWPQSNNPIDQLNIAQSIADGATFPDHFFMGSPLRSVRSATEVDTLNQAANALLADYMLTLTTDLAGLAEDIWEVLYHYRFSPEKISTATKGDDDYMVADEDIEPSEYAQMLAEYAITRLGMSEEMALQMAQKAFMQGKFIPGVKRTDFQWVVNGAELVPNKLERAMKMKEVLSMWGLVMAAENSRKLWKALKYMLEDMDIRGWRDILGEEPDKEELTMEEMLQWGAVLRDMRQGSPSAGG